MVGVSHLSCSVFCFLVLSAECSRVFLAFISFCVRLFPLALVRKVCLKIMGIGFTGYSSFGKDRFDSNGFKLVFHQLKQL